MADVGVVHLFLSSVENETRLFKESAYVLDSEICSRVHVLGVWREELRLSEVLDFGLQIERFRLLSHVLSSKERLWKISALRKMSAAISYLQYGYKCSVRTRELKPDHVSCHNALLLPVAWFVSKLVGATLEYLPHELETKRTGLTGQALVVTRFIEKLFINRARHIVVVCDPIKEWYQDNYQLSEVLVVRNVPERSATQLRKVDGGDFRARFEIPDGAKVFIYQGQFGVGRGISLLIETFAGLANKGCHLIFMGYGEGRYHTLVEDAATEHINIHYQPAVDRELIASYSAGADVGIFISESTALSYKYSLPNKFFEWLHAGLPIIVTDNLEYQASIISNMNLGKVTSIENLENAILEMLTEDFTAFKERALSIAKDAYWESDAKVFRKVYGNK